MILRLVELFPVELMVKYAPEAIVFSKDIGTILRKLLKLLMRVGGITVAMLVT